MNLPPPRYALVLTALLLATVDLSGCSDAAHDSHAMAHDAMAHDAAGPETRWSGTTAKGLYHVTLSPEPSPPPVAQLFSVTATVQAADLSGPVTVTKASLDAWMPAHGHGMEGFTPKTTVSPGTIGEVVTKGMFFTMPGQWELTFTIEAGASGPDEVVLPVHVGP